MRFLPVVSHPDYDAGFMPGHRFPMGKYSALRSALAARGLLGDLHVPAPPPPAWLKLAHDGDYVDQVLACAVPPAVEREIGFPVGERVSRRAQLATGGTVLAARLALEHGLACNTAGGSHHARRAQGSGFCTFNDVAVAALVLLAEGAIGSALVFDLDVHQGDGTADILRGESRVFTVSLHAEKNFPVRKIASDIDVGLPDAMEDDAYLDAVAALLDRVSGRTPDIVFYNAGVDPHRQDRLGRLALSDAGLRRRDDCVIRYFRTRGIPLCGVIGGGYSTDVAALGARHAILFEAASAIFSGGS